MASSQLTKADMIRLSDLRERLRKPITKLLHDAVKAYYFLIGDAPKAGEQCCDNPRLRWEGERGNAAIVCDGCGFVLADDGQVEDWHDLEQIAWEKESTHSTARSSSAAIFDLGTASRSLDGRARRWTPSRIVAV